MLSLRATVTCWTRRRRSRRSSTQRGHRDGDYDFFDDEATRMSMADRHRATSTVRTAGPTEPVEPALAAMGMLGRAIR